MLYLQKLMTASKLLVQPKASLNQLSQPIWAYVAVAFNRVDIDRRNTVGPNRLCAEWVIKNGGKIRTIEMPGKMLTDYNTLPPESLRFHIKEVDASDASIMKIGFDHFRGCNHIDTLILHNCQHLEEDGLEGLIFLQNSLINLQVSECYNITDAGLLPIGEMKNLKRLVIFDMLYVENLDAVLKDLQGKLPGCKILGTK